MQGKWPLGDGRFAASRQVQGASKRCGIVAFRSVVTMIVLRACCDRIGTPTGDCRRRVGAGRRRDGRSGAGIGRIAAIARRRVVLLFGSVLITFGFYTVKHGTRQKINK